MGALGDEAVDFIHKLGRRVVSVSGEKRATEFLLQRLSVAIQRGNAASVMSPSVRMIIIIIIIIIIITLP